MEKPRARRRRKPPARSRLPKPALKRLGRLGPAIKGLVKWAELPFASAALASGPPSAGALGVPVTINAPAHDFVHFADFPGYPVTQPTIADAEYLLSLA